VESGQNRRESRDEPTMKSSVGCAPVRQKQWVIPWRGDPKWVLPRGGGGLWDGGEMNEVE